MKNGLVFHTCGSFGSNSSKLAGDTMSSGIEVGQAMTIASCSTKLLTSASQVTANKAQPQVLAELAVSAVCVF